ncbi:MAG: thrombospondin type 3 repeat-containing protein [Thermodesulfobacteriota bacterium]|nr:thrombospondin type 3 repeat-containing protein [Thermodesulfobacteriota bacterium]
MHIKPFPAISFVLSAMLAAIIIFGCDGGGGGDQTHSGSPADPAVNVEFEGRVERFDDAEIVVDGFPVTIAPASGFNPSALQVGDDVRITGHFLDDYAFQVDSLNNYTFQAESMATILFDDQDGDGISDEDDNCPDTVNWEQVDTDGDDLGNACDDDDDNDSVPDREDNCPLNFNPNQTDDDGVGGGNACDSYDDIDGDGIPDNLDNCPDTNNREQEDTNDDGIGNACDEDNDGVLDGEDNCPSVPNPNQTDLDNNQVGDACQEFDDIDDNDCMRQGHPVATVYATEFVVSYDKIMRVHCSGNGFGGIGRALLISDLEDVDAPWEAIIAMHKDMGWGAILKQLDTSPSDFAPGRVISKGKKDKDKKNKPEKPEKKPKKPKKKPKKPPGQNK